MIFLLPIWGAIFEQGLYSSGGYTRAFTVTYSSSSPLQRFENIKVQGSWIVSISKWEGTKIGRELYFGQSLKV